jgi:hypothetical protein
MTCTIPAILCMIVLFVAADKNFESQIRNKVKFKICKTYRFLCHSKAYPILPFPGDSNLAGQFLYGVGNV